MTEPKEYIRTLRASCKDTLKQGRQIDFFDALAISRPTGEQAVFWMLPALREAQEERGAALVQLAELRALVDELLSIMEPGDAPHPSLLPDILARLRRAIKEGRQ